MKLIVLLTICSIFTVKLSAQVVLLPITIASHPPPRISDWESQRETLTILIINNSPETIEAKFEASLSLNGTIAATTKTDNMPTLRIKTGTSTFFAGDVFPQQAISFIGDAKQQVLRSGLLPEGNYEVCIKLLDSKSNRELSTGQCANFSLIAYSTPTLLAPRNGIEIVSGLEQSIFFSWTPIVPTPSGSISYRLRIVELLPSQNVKLALTRNRPLFDRQINSITGFSWPNEVHLPSKGGAFVWSVRAEDATGMPIIAGESFAEPFTISLLPSQEDCLQLLSDMTKRKDSLLSVEERYWKQYQFFLRISSLLDDAEQRADAFDIKKLTTEKERAEPAVISSKLLHEKLRGDFDAAVERYKQCLGK